MKDTAEIYRQIASEAVQNYQASIKSPVSQKRAMAIVDEQFKILNYGVAPSRAGEPLYMRYLGVLGLLGECSVFLPSHPNQEGSEFRDSIQQAFEDACEAHPNLMWRRILNRLEIEVQL